MCEASVTDPAAPANVLSDCLLPSAHRPLSNAAAWRIAHTWLGWSRLETGPRYQQNCTECHKDKARPIRSEPQESQAAPWRLQSITSGPGGIPATKRSPPNSGARHVQDSPRTSSAPSPIRNILASQSLAPTAAPGFNARESIPQLISVGRNRSGKIRESVFPSTRSA